MRPQPTPTGDTHAGVLPPSSRSASTPCDRIALYWVSAVSLQRKKRIGELEEEMLAVRDAGVGWAAVGDLESG